MEKKSTAKPETDIRRLTKIFPEEILKAVQSVSRSCARDVYLVGGTVRDWLLGELKEADIDLTVADGAVEFCHGLIRELGGGAFVPLGTESEEAGRVVWRGVEVDISSFRGGAITLEADLGLRDFTINSMAVPVNALGDAQDDVKLIDPLGGRKDLGDGVIKHSPRAFVDDPLRLLRAYRFMARFGFRVDSDTERTISRRSGDITRVAAERVRHELDMIMESRRAGETMWRMHEVGLLYHIVPELYLGRDIEQPGFHHLDVFEHNFQALREVEQLAEQPQLLYGRSGERMAEYLDSDRAVRCLKYASLFHDLGKPGTRDESQVDESRVTFYGHDEYGRELFEKIAARLKWSRGDTARTGVLIAMHMHPFHLCNVKSGGKLTRRAALKICRKAGDQLAGLFLLAMADSLASRGELKPEDMELQLAALYDEIVALYDEHIAPVMAGPPLLGGRDLISEFDLEPGPQFSVILTELEALRVEGRIRNRQEAVAWVGQYLEGQGGENGLS